ncbi:MAG: hypothetical protein BWY41_00030 [Candidatus Atribacteria bacterium ADurb.Bin276]|uniref:Uncharacterized protein n=1 Tax=Candidatus Atribacter allofermentans TaxID=1852833 RepID=A0A1V5T4N8_9BACT|nr:MAG: hypothetical protein BWY41_00030 [Candidatus Atribacteria bacterium ADurb.Bin276]
MSEFEREIFRTILEIVKSGGVHALYGITIYFGFQILKILILGGFVWTIIRLTFSTIREIYSNWLKAKEMRVSLVSKELSENILSTIKSYQDSMASILREISNGCSPPPPPPERVEEVGAQSTQQPKSRK